MDGAKGRKLSLYLTAELTRLFAAEVPRIGQNGPVAQRPLAKLHSSLKPANQHSFGQQLRGRSGYILVMFEGDFITSKGFFYLIHPILGAPEVILLRITGFLVQETVVDIKGGSHGYAAVIGAGRDEHIFEWGVFKDFGVVHRVHHTAAGESQVAFAGPSVQMAEHMGGGLFKNTLEGAGNIVVPLLDGVVPMPGRAQQRH